jgi:hypothetical protein
MFIGVAGSIAREIKSAGCAGRDSPGPGSDELDVGSEVAQRGIAGEELIDVLEGAKVRVVHGVFGKELAIPEIADLEFYVLEESFDALPGVKTVVVPVAARTGELLGPGKFGREEEAKEESAGLQDACDFRDGGGIVGDVLEDAEAEEDVEGGVGVGEPVSMGEGGDVDVEALEDGGLLAEGGVVIVLVELEVAGFEASGAKVAYQLADLAFATAPVEDLKLMEG